MSQTDLRTTATVKLQFPVTVDAVTYSELTMRRSKTKDNLAASKVNGSDAERGVFMLARLCDVSPEVIEELDDLDTQALTKQLEAFQGR